MNVGSHIGQYRIVRKIGAGGMGSVFVGEHILLGRQAAIKTLLPSLSAQLDVVERFFREARAASAVRDPGVVQIYDFGYHVDGTAYIVMELLEGESLAGRIRRLGVLPVAEALRIARQIAGALAVVHDAKIVHRDLKPENIFLVRDTEAQGGERAKLLDFGICKLGDDYVEADANTAIGTPMYMSPEQCAGIDVDGRSDVYGLGCVLFQMLTGRVPFEREHREDVMEAHVAEAPPMPSERILDLMPLVDEIIAHCLAKSPEERFQSTTALQYAIDQILPQLTPVPLGDAPVAMALSAGFKTNYDGNFRSAAPKRSVPKMSVPKLSSDWFIASTPEPHTLQAMTGELVIAQQPKSRSMLAILVAGAAVALIGTLLSQIPGDDEPGVALAVANAIDKQNDSPPDDPSPIPTPDPAPTPDPMPLPPNPDPDRGPGPHEPEPEPEVAIVHEATTVRAAVERPAAEVVAKAPVAKTPIAKAPVAPAAVRRAVVVKKPPPPPPPRRNVTPVAPKQAEDLYETR